MDQGRPSYVRGVRAEKVSRGDRFITRTGAPSAPVASVRILRDSFGTPALVEARLEDGRDVTIAHGSTIRVHTCAHVPGPSLQGLGSAPAGSPEAVLLEIAQAHPEEADVLEPVSRLGRGFNAKSGAHLGDVRELATLLFVRLADERSAWKALDLLTGLPFDGNSGRWQHVQRALALASYLAENDGDTAAAARYAQTLRAAEQAEAGDGPQALPPDIRQRQLDQPDLLDREIHRSMAAGDETAEREWRIQRLDALLHLRAHGGSRTLGREELRRMIQIEVEALRGL